MAKHKVGLFSPIRTPTIGPQNKSIGQSKLQRR